MSYSVHAGEQLVALISFWAAAWKLADSERYVGWTDAQRRGRLHRAVNNARFLILLWRVNLDERLATIWMRTVSRHDDHARHLIVAG